MDLHLSLRAWRKVHNDSTIEFDGKHFTIAPALKKYVTVRCRRLASKAVIVALTSWGFLAGSIGAAQHGFTVEAIVEELKQADQDGQYATRMARLAHPELHATGPSIPPWQIPNSRVPRPKLLIAWPLFPGKSWTTWLTFSRYP